MREYGEITDGVLWLSKTQVEVRRSDYFIVVAEAVQNRSPGMPDDVESVRFRVHAGIDHGMTHSGMPCWTNHGPPTIFKTVEEAQKGHVGIGGIWNARIDDHTIRVRRVVEVVRTYRDEYDLDEALKKIEAEKAAFTRYHGSR